MSELRLGAFEGGKEGPLWVEREKCVETTHSLSPEAEYPLQTAAAFPLSFLTRNYLHLNSLIRQLQNAPFFCYKKLSLNYLLFSSCRKPSGGESL